MDITYVASLASITINQSPGFTVMPNNCHSNSVLVSHVAMDGERFVASFSIRVDNIRAACGLWTVQFNFTACFSCKTKKEEEEEEENKLKNVKQLFDISNVIIKNENRLLSS